MCRMPRRLYFECFLVLLSVIFFGSCDKLPKGISISDIPHYYFDNHYLDNKVIAIKEAIEECSDDYEAFFWITDIHWESNLNTRKSPYLIRYLASMTGINKVLNGGDTGNSQVICNNAISQLKEAIGSNSVYTVTGNHEMNDASRYESPFERVADELRGHNSDIVYGDKNKTYFYFDNKNDRVRYIGLSSYGYFLDNSYESCYNTEQLAWFTDTALNVNAGWTIVVFTHSLYYVNDISDRIGTGPSGANRFIDAIDNYKGNGTISCVLMGHSHRDRIHVGSTGVPYIISACDRYVAYHGDINVDRAAGTISEQHFEVVGLDKGRRTVKLFSIGAKARDGYDDVSGTEVEARIVNY